MTYSNSLHYSYLFQEFSVNHSSKMLCPNDKCTQYLYTPTNQLVFNSLPNICPTYSHRLELCSTNRS